MQNGTEDVTHHVKPQPLIPDATTDTNRHLENVTTQLDTSAANLTQEILHVLDNRGLDITDVVGQAYDGAANMAGALAALGSDLIY